MRKHILRPLLLAFTAILVIATPVLAAYLYYTQYTVANSSATAYDMFPATQDASNEWMADNHFMQSDAMDTAVETLGGSPLPWMVATDRTTTAVPVPATNDVNLYYTMGNDPLATSMDIIPGYDGYITMYDAAGLEFAADFESKFTDTWVDIDVGADKNLIYKDDAFKTYVRHDVAGSITSGIIGWASPIGFVDNGVWATETLVYDGDTATMGTESIGGTSWGSALELEAEYSSWCSEVRIYADFSTDLSLDQVDIDIYNLDTTAWEDVHQGGYNQLVWDPYAISPPVFTNRARVAFYNSGGAPKPAHFREFDFRQEVVTVTAAGVVSGEHDVLTTYDGANLKIYVDDMGVPEDTDAWVGTVPANAGDWVINQSNAAPYIGVYEHTVSSALITRYQPNDMIENEGLELTTDAGAGTDTNIEDTVNLAGYADDYWIGARVICLTATNAANEGISRVCTDFDDANDRVVVVALPANVTNGDTFTIDFGTLPDREVAANDARITWGVNPTGIAVSFSPLRSATAPSAPPATTPAPDILPVADSGGWFGAPDAAALALNPFHPIVEALAEFSESSVGAGDGFTETQVWRLFGIMLILLMTAGGFMVTKGHMLIGCIGAISAVILLVSLTIFPMVYLVAILPLFIAGLVMERSPSI